MCWWSQQTGHVNPRTRTCIDHTMIVRFDRTLETHSMTIVECPYAVAPILHCVSNKHCFATYPKVSKLQSPIFKLHTDWDMWCHINIISDKNVPQQSRWWAYCHALVLKISEFSENLVLQFLAIWCCSNSSQQKHGKYGPKQSDARLLWVKMLMLEKKGCNMFVPSSEVWKVCKISWNAEIPCSTPTHHKQIPITTAHSTMKTNAAYHVANS